MTYRVVFSPEAAQGLADLYNYIAEAASADIAARYTEGLVTYCERLNLSPFRGLSRDDIRPGLRLTNFKKRAIIAFAVDIEAGQVSILGLFYGGQDYETILREAQD